jgi:hypothetical protein
MKSLIPTTVGGIFLAVSSAGVLYAQRTVIDFNDRCSLAALSYVAPGGQVVRAARGTFVPGKETPSSSAYREDGMIFLDGVHPPDPALGPIAQPEYHLMYENPIFNEPLNESEARLPHPENEPRVLAPHLPGAVIQLTYDPNNDGIPDRFNLISLDVLGGALNVGVLSRRLGVAVYNNLTAGFTWFLIDANNLTRATLELPVSFGGGHASGFVVDNIVFEPVSVPPPPSPCPTTGQGGQEEPSGAFLNPPPLSAYYFGNLAPLPRIDVKPGDALNRIDLENDGELRVAILTTRGFDAGGVDPGSARLGADGARPEQTVIRDVDGDGDLDQVLTFNIRQIGIQCADTYLSLTGRTADRRAFTGSDFINPSGCRDSARS